MKIEQQKLYSANSQALEMMHLLILANDLVEEQNLITNEHCSGCDGGCDGSCDGWCTSCTGNCEGGCGGSCGGGCVGSSESDLRW